MICDLLRIIRFLCSGVRKKGAGLPVTWGWHLRASFKKRHFARNPILAR